MYQASPVAQRLKRLPAMRETWVRSLGWEDPLEKEMATHSSILAWRIPWTEEPGGLQSSGSQRVGQDRATSLFTFFHMPYVFSYPHILTTHPAFPLHHHPGLVTVVPHPTHRSDLLSGPYISFPTGQSEGPVKRTS